MKLTKREQEKFDRYKKTKVLLQGLSDSELRNEIIEDVLEVKDGFFGSVVSDSFLRKIKREFERRGIKDFDKTVMAKRRETYSNQ